uniref:Uncharacterized protein n=1 Tax=Nyssomyia neivai TaxID=330878 RepID=A0A1L8DBX5_9DIPT
MNDTLWTIVNGASLRTNVGQQVIIVLKVEEYEVPSKLLKGTTTDDTPVTINMRSELESNLRGAWVQAIGLASKPDTIDNGEVVILPEDEKEFDKKSHNIMMKILSTAPKVYEIEENQ